ncbi:hypothetical protein B296_00045331 [Ensete ventricosum]|uniref:Uncharacterized protein n=1 Tax=Ensete ventricosum TaxID=4639 RepID=A0A426YBC3_ENSVE|nr:hypothetical protein B296_00045331 [Ensete ventricosum]
MAENKDSGNDKSGCGITTGSSTTGKERDSGGRRLCGCRRWHWQVLQQGTVRAVMGATIAMTGTGVLHQQEVEAVMLCTDGEEGVGDNSEG